MKPQRVLTKTAALRRDANLSKGYAAVFATVFIWSLPSLFMYYLNRFYDPWAQNFYRYSVACIAIVPFVLWQIRRGGPRIDMHAIALCLVPCVPNVIHQITQVMHFSISAPASTRFSPGFGHIHRALALAFFPEERFVIRQWQFQLGTLLGLIGAFGVIWFQPTATPNGFGAYRTAGLFIALLQHFAGRFTAF